MTYYTEEEQRKAAKELMNIAQVFILGKLQTGFDAYVQLCVLLDVHVNVRF